MSEIRGTPGCSCDNVECAYPLHVANRKREEGEPMKMEKIMAVAAAVAIAIVALTGCNVSSRISGEPQAENGRFLSDLPICYVVTDTETGVQYLYALSGNSGGITVLLNADGTPCTVGVDG